MARNFRRLFSRSTRNSAGQPPVRFSPSKTHRPARKANRSCLGLESLEGRIVLASPLVSYVLSGTADTTVVGTVYDDVDKSGDRTNGENGVSGWTVYLDLDNSGTLNRDVAGDLEPSAVTNQDGDFVIDHLMPGTYRLTEVMQSGWEATAPMFQDVTIVRNRDTPSDFFNFSGGDIVGVLWNDLDQDGNRATDPSTGAYSEPGLANWTVFLDLNDDRALDADEPSTLTDSSGNYAFYNLPEGDYEVTEVKPDTWDVSPGYDIRQTAAVVARSQYFQDFANFSMTDGSIDGTIWNDLNFDGIRQSDPDTGEFVEPGLEGWTVFLDTNDNGVLDGGELSAMTGASGGYAFVSLPEGDYEVTEILPPGWDLSPGYDVRQTVAVFAGERSTANDIANFTVLNGSIRGTVWNDLNRDGIRNTGLTGAFTEPGVANWRVYLDRNRNGIEDSGEPSLFTSADGSYSFVDLQVGDYEVREILPVGWEPSLGHDDSYGVTVNSGVVSTAPDFAVFDIAATTPGIVNGTVWNDVDADGVRDKDPSTAAFSDPGIANRTVFVDLNSNGIFDPTEPNTMTGLDGGYSIVGVQPGSIRVILIGSPGWQTTAPTSGSRSITLRNAGNIDGIDFGSATIKDSSIRGTVFADSNSDGVRNAGEKGLAGIVLYLDLDDDGVYDPTEPSAVTSADQFFTPDVNEAGTYGFTHLASGTYAVRTVLPETLSATPSDQRSRTVVIAGGQGQTGVDSAARYRPNEIRGVKFDDQNGNGQREPGEPGVGGSTIFIDLDRDGLQDAGEPTTSTQSDGSYAFSGLTPGAYVVRQVLDLGHTGTFPATSGGILWPQGVSNPAVGNVSPDSITTSLASGESYRQSVSITLPNTGALTNLVDVFLLFDDTGSFVNNSPIVRSAFPTIISQLQASMPGIDLGFGVGRFEEYANFASEYSTGRPFILNQPIVAANTAGYMDAIQSALNRTTPGYGGDLPETDLEALYQLVTGLGFDGNNNGSVLDSGNAGLVSTQLTPGGSGDVPSFASFRPDPSGNVMAAAGSIGGGGFRSGALPIILVATDTGFAYQPKGETTITGVGGTSLSVNSFTQTSRSTTPFGAGAGIQQTITGLNALGGLVIGLGTNFQSNVDPRQGLEAISKLTGAVNRTTTTIANGTSDPIAPGDPFYFQISSGFAGSVSNGIVSAIQNAVTNVAVDITIQASDPRVRIINHSGVWTGIGSSQTATFDVEFVGDGVPRRFDLQFVRSGTNVILGSIPVVIGTPIPGDGYEFEDLEEGEIEFESDFGSSESTSLSGPTITVTGGSFGYDGTTHGATATAAGIGGVTVPGSFVFDYDGSTTPPVNAGTYVVQAFFTSDDPNYADASGTANLIIEKAVAEFSQLNAPIVDEGNATTSVSGRLAGSSVIPVGGTVSVTFNGLASTGIVDGYGNFTVILSTAGLAVGTYPVTVRFAGDGSNFASSVDGITSLTVASVSHVIEVAGLAFNAIAGAPHRNAVATIVNALGGSSAYAATIDWGDGTTSVGTIAESGGTLIVFGDHTYADPGSKVIRVLVTDTLGLGSSATATEIATVTSLDVRAGKTSEAEFWAKSIGQSLIRRFDGNSSSTRLAYWLASNFPNLYGANAGSSDLTAMTNNQVAWYFNRLWRQSEDSAEVQILTTALNVYATTASLGGSVSSSAGFRVSDTGLGATWFNVGEYGSAVGVPNRTKLNVYQMLVAVNRQARDGRLYDGNSTLRSSARSLFKKLNSI
jgi:hypothetical protein